MAIGLAFDEVILDPVTHGIQGYGFIGNARHDHDGQMRRRLARAQEGLPAGAVRQGQVQQQHIEVLLCQAAARGRPRIDVGHFQLGRPASTRASCNSTASDALSSTRRTLNAGCSSHEPEGERDLKSPGCHARHYPFASEETARADLVTRGSVTSKARTTQSNGRLAGTARNPPAW